MNFFKYKVWKKIIGKREIERGGRNGRGRERGVREGGKERKEELNMHR